MLDPVTLSAAVSGATAAFNTVKKLCAAGREIEDISSDLGRWMTAVSDIDNINKKAKNPSTLDKIFNGSVEEVALNSFAAKKKIESQRTELKNYLIGSYGTSAWDDLIREEGRIRRARAEAVYKREEHRKMVREYTIIGIACLIGFISLAWIVWIITLSISQ